MYAIFINGSYGVGKSSVLEHIGDLLAQNQKPFSLMDVDWFHRFLRTREKSYEPLISQSRSWPTDATDPENTKIEARNMAAVWDNYREAGPRQLVVSGVIHTISDQERYEQALRLPVRPILLDACPEIQESRLRGRYGAERQVPLQWHLDRFASIAEELRQSACNELTISTDTSTPHEVATAILLHFRLLD